ncbi:MAG: TolC family protein [Bacteroidota bacterium]
MRRTLCLFWLLIRFAPAVQPQSVSDSLLQSGSLQNFVYYALMHQPAVHQSSLDEEITDRTIQSKLADWYPQLNFSYNIVHFPQVPISIVGGNPFSVNLPNTSTGQLSLTQTLFNRDVLLASSSASDVRRRAREQTITQKIDVVVLVSKAYYAVLETQQQIALLDEDIVRLRQSLKDAYEQYHGGVVDNIDYKRAMILLNNALQEKVQNVELLKARYVFLKDQMGCPMDTELHLEYDSTQMEREAFFDTSQILNVENRIEYQALQTQKRLLETDVAYEKWSFLPSLSVYANYAFNYQADVLTRVYDQNYPSSLFGLQLSFPIFEGGKRMEEIQRAKLESQRIDDDFLLLQNSVTAEYAQATAAYKSNLNTYAVLKENQELAKDVYHTIQLQYKAGTKTYLEVITAESELRETQVNYTSALYQVLSSKLDVQKALGIIHY